jgi:hypothetical protein
LSFQDNRKVLLTALVFLALLMSVSLALVYAGGDKNQHEIGAPEAPGRAMMRKAIKRTDYFRVFCRPCYTI